MVKFWVIINVTILMDKLFSLFGRLAAVILIIGILAAGGFYLGKRFSSRPASSPMPISESSPVAPTLSNSLLPPASPKPTPDDFSLIRDTLILKTGISQDDIQVVISQNTGQHVKGTVKDRNDVGGGYFLAAKVGETWIIVYDGQSQPGCSQVNSYNFPKDMVPECLDTGGNLVTR
ncbi:hypothetical protein A2165_02530 [Candidatus Curtissbacteria bacterium RBG_13_40_7]|uniref:Uncharacterized protein n=1 Tax=Candidatus Curtissbacteria bacterium RBG_13_40_7 TaxID=1797706 RepID=A0A1F5FY82_9BACT|nr:MAG: hypothetical protein A2165_02530 [Candidatus Curtissbacteria bacterium RBG_13_40_7]